MGKEVRENRTFSVARPHAFPLSLLRVSRTSLPTNLYPTDMMWEATKRLSTRFSDILPNVDPWGQDERWMTVYSVLIRKTLSWTTEYLMSWHVFESTKSLKPAKHQTKRHPCWSFTWWKWALWVLYFTSEKIASDHARKAGETRVTEMDAKRQSNGGKGKSEKCRHSSVSAKRSNGII